MTKTETTKLLSMIQAIYPCTTGNKDALVNIWCMDFEKIPYQVAVEAFNTFRRNDKNGNFGRFPTPGQILDIIKTKHKATLEDAEKAWAKVLRAGRNSRDYSKTEFNKLPEPLQKAVGSSKFLYELANASDFRADKMKDRFLISYEKVMEQQAFEMAITGTPLQISGQDDSIKLLGK